VKYFVTIGAQTREVEVDRARVLLGGEALDANLAGVPGTPLYHMLLGGESWTVAVQPLEGTGRWVLGVAGERVEVEVQDEQTRDKQALTGQGQNPTPSGREPVGGSGGRGDGGSGGGTVRAPMPGLVVRLEVAAGQRVEVGAGLVVVEAMKMENEVRAPRAGVVETVHVAVGQAVEKGAPLVTVASGAGTASPNAASSTS
jgi:biotin carboxyl carrier protein